MSSLTLTIDEELLRRARIRALEQGTSVNALVREWLEGFADSEDERRATEDLLALAARSTASSGPRGRTWTRDQLYDERLSKHDGSGVHRHRRLDPRPPGNRGRVAVGSRPTGMP